MSFTFRKAVRDGSSPLLIGLIGPSGGGKTKSALRLATGIIRVRGGKIAAIDTEAKRMLHYAEHHDFQHLHFTAPFGSARYLDALEAAAKEAAGGCVIVDSMSHEHEGAGGYLEGHEVELDRIAGQDYKKRQNCNFLAWAKPASERRRLINSLLQLNCAFIFCFRAKEKLKIVKGEKEPIQLGWQAIAGEEFAYEMTVRCLLPPGANGVPNWSKDAFEHYAAKRPDDFAGIFADGLQLDEEIGEQAARWAQGTPAVNWQAEIAIIDAVPHLNAWFKKHEPEFGPQQLKEVTAACAARKKEILDKLAAEAAATKPDEPPSRICPDRSTEIEKVKILDEYCNTECPADKRKGCPSWG